MFHRSSQISQISAQFTHKSHRIHWPKVAWRLLHFSYSDTIQQVSQKIISIIWIFSAVSDAHRSKIKPTRTPISENTPKM